MKTYDRKTGKYIEDMQYGQGGLSFLYGSVMGRFLLRIVVSPFVSRIYGWWGERKCSAKKIPGFIRDNGIDMDDFEDREFSSFNDFFTRKLRPGARQVDADPLSLIAPADSRVLAYPVDDDTAVYVKGRKYTLAELVGDRLDTSSYAGGVCLVYRLCVDDYHRYCFIDDGKLLLSYRIDGRLHTVRPVSDNYRVFAENTRVVSILSTEHFGEVIHIEVGALLVGRIVNREVTSFKKGEEKGYFEPGGSTIIQIFRKGAVTIDSDILVESKDLTETRVYFGEKVGNVNDSKTQIIL